MNWEFLKSKLFWIAVITVIVEIIGYITTNNYFPEATVPLSIVVAALGFISEAIGGTVNAVRLRAARAKLLEH
jgi:hypothetical protein